MLALACLVAAAATLSAQTVPGDAAASAARVSRPPLPLLLPLSVLLFLLVVGAVLRRDRVGGTSAPSADRRASPR